MRNRDEQWAFWETQIEYWWIMSTHAHRPPRGRDSTTIHNLLETRERDVSLSFVSEHQLKWVLNWCWEEYLRSSPVTGRDLRLRESRVPHSTLYEQEWWAIWPIDFRWSSSPRAWWLERRGEKRLAERSVADSWLVYRLWIGLVAPRSRRCCGELGVAEIGTTESQTVNKKSNLYLVAPTGIALLGYFY